MKITQRILSVVLLTFLTLVSLRAQCGNCSSGGPSGPGPTPTPAQTQPQPDPNIKGDPVNIYTGNENRRNVDLVVAGAVGQTGLVWERFGNSRFTGRYDAFGSGHNWRHGYQWNFWKTGLNAQGQDTVLLIYPDGSQYTYVNTAPGVWASEVRCRDLLVEENGDYILKRVGGERFKFKSHHWWGSTWYFLREIEDVHGLVTHVEVNGYGDVTKVTEPGGRTLQVTWDFVPMNLLYQWPVAYASSQIPTPQTWVEINVASPLEGRYCSLIAADLSYGNFSEVEFYEAVTNQKLTGVLISSDPLAEAQKAVDNDENTSFVSVAQSGGFVGYDFATPKKVGKVRFKMKAGTESLIYAGWWKGFTPAVQVGIHSPWAIRTIAKVEGSDGRKVDYVYENFQDPNLPYVYPCLKEAIYGDGTKATYTYKQIFAGTAPLVETLDEPRYELRQKKQKIKYYDDIATAIQGRVFQQINPDTNGVIMEIGLYQNNHFNIHLPEARFANSGAERVYNDYAFPLYAVDSLNRSTQFTYDARGFTQTEADALGRVMSYEHNFQGNLIKRTYPDGSYEQWTRDSREQVLTYRDTLGRVTTYTRDAQHRVTRIDFPDSSYETFAYNAFSQITQKRLRNGGIQSYVYDSRGLLTQQSDPLGNITKFGYDSRDRLNSITDARNNITTMIYNERGLLTKQTHPDSSFKSMSYDAYGNLISETNELGNSSLFSYDIFQRMTSSVDPLGRVTHLTYLTNAYEKEPLQITLPSGKKIAMTYDLDWNKISQTTGFGTTDASTTTYQYDVVNNLIQMTDGRGKIWKNTFDSRDRKITSVDPLNNTESWTYDFEGNVLTFKDALNRVTTNVYDSMDRVSSTTDAKNQTTNFFYDASGNMIKMVDAKNNAYQNTFDLLNRKTSMIYPDNSKEQYGYDSVSNVVSYTTRVGQIKISTFDNRNRETNCDWSDSTPDITRTFDALGRVQTSNNGISSITYQYNAANELLTELTQVAGGQPRAVAYTYTVDGNRDSVTYPDGSVVSYGYTGRNQINGINDSGTQLVGYSYNLNGDRIQKALSNGTSTEYTFDDASRLTGLTDKKGATTLLSTVYTLNAVGNRTAKAQDGKTETYGFDAIDQVTAVTYGTSRNVNYQYDSVGNRVSVTDNGVATNYSTNNLNQYSSVTSASSAVNSVLGYDGNGNLINGGTIQSGLFFYDAQNRLTRAVVSGNTTDFDYDSKNRVVKRSLNSVPTFLIYDGWSLIEERTSTGSVSARYVHGTQIDEILTKTDSVGTIYYHHDALGSVTQITNAIGTMIEKYLYDIFGKVTMLALSGAVLTTSSRGNRFFFTGREFLKDVGLYDYRNRVYSQELGRFLQTDPIRFSAGDVNLYRYCGNHSVGRRDVMGLCDDEEEEKSIFEEIWENGITINIDIGDGLGFSFEFSISSTGMSAYGGIGLGIGLGASLSTPVGPQLTFGQQSGLTVSGSVSGGNGVVGGSYGGNASQGGASLGGSGGIGIGVGATVTAGVSGTVSW